MNNKIEEYVKENIVVGESIHNSWYNKERKVKYVYVNCPCGKDSLQHVEAYLDKDNNLQGDYHISELSWKLFGHIERKIRFNPDKKHIDILIQLIGKEEALELIEKWAKKNIAIGMILLKYIKNIKCVSEVDRE